MLVQKPKSKMNLTLHGLDDSSTHSTVTVDRGTKKALHESCETKKSVSFNLDRTETYACTYNMKDTDRKALWYRGAEYKRLKEETFDRVRTIITSEGNNANEDAYRKVMQAAFDACKATKGAATKKVLPKEDRKRMQRWAKSEEDVWGLEKWAVRKLRCDKFTRRKELTDKVLQLQSEEMNCSDETKGEIIRQWCEEISRQTVHFSYLMGYSQAMAITKNKK